jgi:2-(1,2-epoxy-1,2-dihydrophenyl)acetyl-CoA isomerase
MPPLGGLFLLPRLVGMGRAMEICLQGRPVLAEEAARIGLVSELVAADALAEAGMAKARELAALPPTAYASAKQAMQRGLESTMEAEWQANVATQAVLLASEDFREGLAAVTEKRAPRFTGR